MRNDAIAAVVEPDAGKAAMEARANSATHALGLAASAAGAAVLMTMAARAGTALALASTAVFAASLVALYGASTLYHTARTDASRARRKVLDHCAIYVLIAGSYTPFCLVGIRGAWGWSLFGVVWGLALAGIVFKLFFTGRFRIVSTLMYIGMGWIVVIAAGPMARTLSGGTIAWLVAGGLAYTVGTLFYALRKMPYSHAVWHLFVMAGSACHAVGVATLLARG